MSAPDRIGLNPPEMVKKYGPLDEVVITDCNVHLEQMSKKCFYLGITRGEATIQIWITIQGQHVHAAYDIVGEGFPLPEPPS